MEINDSLRIFEDSISREISELRIIVGTWFDLAQQLLRCDTTESAKFDQISHFRRLERIFV